MKHILNSKINQKELDHAKSRGEAKVKMQEIIAILTQQSEQTHFDQELIAFHFHELFTKMFIANTISMQIGTLQGILMYED